MPPSARRQQSSLICSTAMRFEVAIAGAEEEQMRETVPDTVKEGIAVIASTKVDLDGRGKNEHFLT